MIRQAVASDLPQILDAYEEHFCHEETHTAYTVFARGVYPSERDAIQALDDDGLWVAEEEGRILGSMIVKRQQPDDYRQVPWQMNATDADVLVVHLLMVRPSASGHGIGRALMAQAEQLARAEGRRILRLDTGSQNTPAVHLYTSLGYHICATAPMNVGGVVPHDGHLFLEKVLV